MSDSDGRSDGLTGSSLGRSYGPRRIFAQLNFSLEPGGILAVTGPNGSGKSTLLRILAGVSRPTEGQVCLAGLSINPRTEPESLAARGSIGYVGHRPGLYPELTGLENLLFFARLYDLDDPESAARRGLEAVGLAAASHIPVMNYSRGMQQRLGLARALSPSPFLLILDEPFTGLDEEGARLLSDIIAGHCSRGGMAVIATHDDPARLGAHKVLSLPAGAVTSRSPFPTADGAPHITSEGTGSHALEGAPHITLGGTGSHALEGAPLAPESTARVAPGSSSRRPSPLRQGLGLVGGSLRSEFRGRQWLASVPLLALVMLTIFGLALNPVEHELTPLIPGLLWAGLSFAAISGMARPFIRLQELGTHEVLAAAPVDGGILYLGHLLSSWIVAMAVALVMTPLFFAFLGYHGPRVSLFSIIFLLGLALWCLMSIGVAAGSVAAQSRSGDSLVPLVAFPLLVPVLLAAVRITEGVLAGGALTDSGPWFRLLVAYGIVFSVLPGLLFDYVAEV